MILRTPRLRLEPVQDSYFEGLRALHSDPLTMRFIGGTKTDEEVRAWIVAAQGHWARVGFNWWAAIEQRTEELLGPVSTQHIENDETQAHRDRLALSLCPLGQGLCDRGRPSDAPLCL